MAFTNTRVTKLLRKARGPIILASHSRGARSGCCDVYVTTMLTWGRVFVWPVGEGVVCGVLMVGPNSASAGFTICRSSRTMFAGALHRRNRRLTPCPGVTSRCRFHGRAVLDTLGRRGVTVSFSVVINHNNLLHPIISNTCRMGRTVHRSLLSTG